VGLHSASSGSVRRLLIIIVLLLGTLLRVLPLSAHRFHEDEALYASWALRTQQDPALLEPYVDKPPLHIYSLVAAERLLGLSEEVFRLPSLLSAVISIALVYAIARRIYDEQIALSAALLFAASPFAILFAPTAFTDSTLVLWMLTALLAVVCRYYVWGGLALGLAYATKQTSLLIMPLVIAGAAIAADDARDSSVRNNAGTSKSRAAAWLLAVLGGFVPPVALVTWWDSLRWSLRPSFWDRSLVTYGGLVLAPVGEWAERTLEWTRLLRYIFASPVLNVLLLVAVLVVSAVALRSLQRDGWGCMSLARSFDLLLIVFSAVFLISHVLVEFRVWDRYLLVIVAPLCLIFARGLDHLTANALSIVNRMTQTRREQGQASLRWLPSSAVVALALILIGLAYPAWQTVAGEIPVGGDHGTYDGIDEVAEYIRANLPAEAKLYYHWTGWHLAYYLYDSPQQTEWYPSSEALIPLVSEGSEDGLSVLVLPDWKDTTQLRATLDSNGIALTPLFCGARSDGSCAFELARIDLVASDRQGIVLEAER